MAISHAMALVDLDNDGDLDLALNCLNAPALLYCNVSSAPRIAIRPRGGAPNSSGIGARIQVDGPTLPTQTQEIVSGGRYLAGDDSLRVFAARPDEEATLQLTWRNGTVSVVTGLEAGCAILLADFFRFVCAFTDNSPPRFYGRLIL